MDPRLDPAECNALQQTAAGLLVPATAVEGIAPGTAVGDGRSVDIDVQAPEDGACPATWTVGARLTPVHGQAGPGTLNLTSVAPATVTPVPGMSVVLPEAGVYEVVADASGSQTVVGPATNAQVRMSLFVAEARISPDTTLTLFSSSIAGTFVTVGSASSRALYQATGPATVQLQGYRNLTSGTQSTAAIVNAYVYFRKVAD
ncbi:hypothetical protein H114_32769 [Streptomyces gancidicus BKS 13-15]|uniref:Uncharacterized protein n=1 Tax=Streptomyces gancidicus BKS 13-15 TaxID=1284664 RepID=M3CSC7_STREZ|nr:hypothetical protein [Streptomyces gancidicus]EMF20415.1 hypothetical protein H114_32769 [Streptomyces gancidicus BKS 13-15]